MTEVLLKVLLNTINQNPKIPTTTQSRYKEMVLLYVVIQLVMLF